MTCETGQTSFDELSTVELPTVELPAVDLPTVELEFHERMFEQMFDLNTSALDRPSGNLRDALIAAPIRPHKIFVATAISAGSPQRQPKSLRGSLLNVNASSAGDACLHVHVQIAVPTVNMLH